MPASETDVLKYDAWLSPLMACPSFNVAPHGLPDASTLAQSPLFVTAKAAIDDIPRIHELERLGFHLIDTSVVFAKERTETVVLPPSVRPARPEDEARVADIAARSFVWSRFHRDPLIPSATAHRIKQAWASNFFRGARGDACLVVEVEGAVAGFLIALADTDHVTTDLIATDPEFQRLGLGRALMRGIEALYPRTSTFRVPTQLANVASRKLYHAMGYAMVESVYVFHFHGRSVYDAASGCNREAHRA